MGWTILIYLFHLITWHVHQSIAEGNVPQVDSTTSGNYVINNCQRANHSTDLHRLLALSSEALGHVLSDLKLGTASPHGFRTFFKSNTNLPIANQVFRAIATGQNVAGNPPVLECASPEHYTGKELEHYRMLCAPPRSRPPHAASLPLQGAVVLCPVFWDLPDLPGMDDCVGVTGRRGRRKFVDTGWALRETRFSVLIHELVHLYNPLDAASTTAEVYDIQPCADLDKKRSVGNAENWALYAASVTAKCTKFPSLPLGGDLRS